MPKPAMSSLREVADNCFVLDQSDLALLRVSPYESTDELFYQIMC